MSKIVYSLALIAICAVSVVIYPYIDFPSPFNSPENNASKLIIPIDSRHKAGQVNYLTQVKPILDARCVGCHSGYNAPCQLKLNSPEGLLRGATKGKSIYSDDVTPAIWRERGFNLLLNDKSSFPELNLNHSLIAKLLTLKQANTLPPVGQLPKSLPVDTWQDAECPSIEQIGDFQAHHPLAGMPYALPSLTKAEQSVVLNWLQDGAKIPNTTVPVSVSAQVDIKKWEHFFNDNTNKSRLIARYLYEHLFNSDLHFEGQDSTEFFKLVRSKTPSGQPIEEQTSAHPYDAPESEHFYYRLRPVQESLTVKEHFVYELSDNKMERINSLFLKPDYSVDAMPAYGSPQVAIPFQVFKDLPVASRYQFLLDDAAHFLAMAFHSPLLSHNKMPIDDQFWLTFIKPMPELESDINAFLQSHSALLQIPKAEQDKIALPQWLRLKEAQLEYLKAKKTFIKDIVAKQNPNDLSLLWDGQRSNENAVLSVFSHHDNATVHAGLLGKTPTSAWVMDYPLLERLHYFLTIGGKLSKQDPYDLPTQQFLKLLRYEAEANFLQMLPKSARQTLNDQWHSGFNDMMFSLLSEPFLDTDTDTAIDYGSEAYQQTFFDKLQQQLSPLIKPDTLNRCQGPECGINTENELPSTETLLIKLAHLPSDAIKILPEVSFLRIKTRYPEQDAVYTLIKNQTPHDLISEWSHGKTEDSLTIKAGLIASDPNQFFDVPESQLENFIDQLSYAKKKPDIGSIYSQYALRRNNPEIWHVYDWMTQKYKEEQPLAAGLFDMSNYENR